jgi:LCP family protein required for cell wall assembly
VSQSDLNTAHAPQNALRNRLLVAFVGLVLIVAAAWLALIIITRIDDLFFPGSAIPVGGLGNLPGVQEGVEEGQVNFLIMGLDRREHEGEIATRTDTMFVLTVDKKTKAAGILGIPRDLWVEIPFESGDGYYEERINTVYAAGESGNYSGGGPSLVKRVVEHNLGVDLNHFVVIDFEGFIEVIDDLGGVDIYVEEEINDPFYSETERPGDYTPLHFEVGEQHMDGQTALNYSRTRYDSSDLDRIHRQQQVIFAAIDKATEQGLDSVDNLTSLWGRYKDAIDTDVSDPQTPGFANLASQIEPEDIVALSLGPATVPFTTADGAQVLAIDKDIVQQIISALFAGQQVAPNTAVVEVQNASGVDGLASRAANYFAEFGFSPDTVLATGASDGTLEPLTEIITFTGEDPTAQRIARLAGVPLDQARPAAPEDGARGTIEGVDILVVLGQDVADRNFTVSTSDDEPVAP